LKTKKITPEKRKIESESEGEIEAPSKKKKSGTKRKAVLNEEDNNNSPKKKNLSPTKSWKTDTPFVYGMEYSQDEDDSEFKNIEEIEHSIDKLSQQAKEKISQRESQNTIKIKNPFKSKDTNTIKEKNSERRK